MTWLRPATQRLALLLGSVLFTFLLIEAGYRLFDPFPFFSAEEINSSEHGNLTEHDRTLGWKGVPGGGVELVTENRRIRLDHNRQGFRDIEHDASSHAKPAIVFLGDSFTWGYEAEFDEMFVNRLRKRLPRYTFINLAHRGYGTDQSLLTFKSWRYDGPLQRVILMFSDNDVVENASGTRYQKPKPMFRLVGEELILTGVPVPRLYVWSYPSRPATGGAGPGRLTGFFLRSHFLHDLHFRYYLMTHQREPHPRLDGEELREALKLTSAILRELKREVEGRGAELVVGMIPAKAEVEELDDSPPYQIEIAGLCRQLGIKWFDLAPSLGKAWLRTYYRVDGHWTPHGHEIAADAIQEYLSLGEN